MMSARGRLEAVAALLRAGPDLVFAARILVERGRDLGMPGRWGAWLLMLDRGQAVEVLGEVEAEMAREEVA